MRPTKQKPVRVEDPTSAEWKAEVIANRSAILKRAKCPGCAAALGAGPPAPHTKDGRGRVERAMA